MAVQAARDTLAVVLKKSLGRSNLSATVEIRLVSGDVDAESVVQWTAISSSEWLVLAQSSGTVTSANPAMTIDVVLIGSGQNDTSISGPLRSSIAVASTMRGGSELFERGTSFLEMAVEVMIEAAVRLTSADVRVQDLDGNDVVGGSEVVTGSALILTARAFDVDRLQICRTAMQIQVELSRLSGANNNSLPLQHRDGNTYYAMLPSSWLGDPGHYTLWIDGGAVTIRFMAVQTSQNQIYLAAGLTAVAAVLVMISTILVRRAQGSLKQRVQKVLMPVFSVGTVALEVWDVYGDYFSYRSFMENRAMAATAWREQLMVPFTLFFGLSCIVSVVSIGLKLKVFVGFARRMLGHASAALDHEQQLADLSQSMVALCLVGLCEDLPMGAHTILFLLRIRACRRCTSLRSRASAACS